MSRIIHTILCMVLLAYVKADSDFPFWEHDQIPVRALSTRNEESIYRLPGDVVPLEYDVYLDLFFAERTDRPFSYDGRVNITIQAVQENVTQIVLHANVDRVRGASLYKNEIPVQLNHTNALIIERQYHFLKVNSLNALVVGENYTLVIEYSSVMNDGPMKRGIWRGWYIDENNIERIYATTHFQPYNARQAFPCWDEPLYKAVFTLHISRPTNYSATFTNTGLDTYDHLDMNFQDRVVEHFLPTPKMSTYLVTFLVSETFKVIANDTSFNPPIRIIGRSNTQGYGDHALNLTVGMTKFFGDYFDMPYESLHKNLYNDHISSPDWASAGTENWGMVSYRELNLIIYPRETIMSVEHYATTLVSHELAHKWFGNLVTCYWWSNTWINEGFASYFGYIASHEVFPQYELHEHFNSRYLQTSLAFDSGSTVPMNNDVNTPSQVTGHFGTISYSKGAAFLRMTVNIISPETFQKACKIFLEDNRLEPVDQYDLYDAFAAAIAEDGSLREYNDFNFTEYYRVWVNEPGYPLLNVDINHSNGEITLTQERFFLNGNTPPTGQIYPIPITYSTKSNTRFRDLKPVSMMSSEIAVIQKSEEEEWVIFNNLQHAHYRVNYDDKTWDLIAEALLNEPETIDHLNRAQIADDVFALMRSERLTYHKGFQILKFLRYESNYHVWTVAISGYTWLRNRLRHLPSQQATFDSFILSYLEHVIETVGYETISNETPTISLTRQEVLQFACNLGHEKCVEESLQWFRRLKNQQWVNPKIRRHVYITGVREGTSEDYTFLLNRFRTSNFANDKLEMLRGLGATKDSELLTEYLDLTLQKEVRSHDKATSFNYALLGNKENANVALEYIKNNIDAIREAYVEDSPANPVQTVLSNLATYLDEPELVDYENWLRTTQRDSLQFNNTINAINNARANIEWGTANADIILSAARDSASIVVTSAIMLLVTTLFTFVL
ncbi:membrane alanyl aminopeptidase-like [Achroia grisella]|uniref:membrane alanyl aminopeptidase-like n=1 Tax=Achroia grisella TaxID=688607 RepID=UPI0027D2D03F|nr:membrane alanyl aminopeptidase-like [Achroia grisella]